MDKLKNTMKKGLETATKVNEERAFPPPLKYLNTPTHMIS